MPFSDRNQAVVGATSVALVSLVVIGALQYDKLPFFTAQKHEYTAYFAESSGLAAGAHVQVSGFQVGAVTSVDLDGARVLITFNVDRDVRLHGTVVSEFAVGAVVPPTFDGAVHHGAGVKVARGNGCRAG